MNFNFKIGKKYIMPFNIQEEKRKFYENINITKNIHKTETDLNSFEEA